MSAIGTHTTESGDAERVEARRRGPSLLAERVTWWLENSIPIRGTKYRVGLDPVLGLIPGAGDVVTALIAVLLIRDAVRLKVGKGVIAAMLLNIAIDLVVGLVPVVGDAFDFAFKANTRNLKLLKSAAAG